MSEILLSRCSTKASHACQLIAVLPSKNSVCRTTSRVAKQLEHLGSQLSEHLLLEELGYSGSLLHLPPLSLRTQYLVRLVTTMQVQPLPLPLEVHLVLSGNPHNLQQATPVLVSLAEAPSVSSNSNSKLNHNNQVHLAHLGSHNSRPNSNLLLVASSEAELLVRRINNRSRSVLLVRMRIYGQVLDP